jgi:hypothetical protein
MINETVLAIAMTVHGAAIVPHVKDKHCICSEERDGLRIAVPTCSVSEYEPNRSFRVANLFTEDGTPKSGRVVVRCYEAQ